MSAFGRQEPDEQSTTAPALASPPESMPSLCLETGLPVKECGLLDEAYRTAGSHTEFEQFLYTGLLEFLCRSYKFG